MMLSHGKVPSWLLMWMYTVSIHSYKRDPPVSNLYWALNPEADFMPALNNRTSLGPGLLMVWGLAWPEGREKLNLLEKQRTKIGSFLKYFLTTEHVVVLIIFVLFLLTIDVDLHIAIPAPSNTISISLLLLVFPSLTCLSVSLPGCQTYQRTGRLSPGSDCLAYRRWSIGTRYEAEQAN